MAHHRKQSCPPPRKQAPGSATRVAAALDHKKLELVVKADTRGTLAAVVSSLPGLAGPEKKLSIINSGIGDINKNDLLEASTGSRLIIGFNVGVMPHIAEECQRQMIEVRLYSLIYTLVEDIRGLLAELLPEEPAETVTGSAKVLALFKSSRKGIIIGCKVQEGRIKKGDRFRLISAMGPVYAGVIESLHIGREAVDQALPGQEAGIKIPDFQKARVGDLVECVKMSKKPSRTSWQPSGNILVFDKR